MDSASSPTSSAVQPPPVEAETAAKPEGPEKEMAHRTKVIQFMGRTTSIILQNDNGPCPLLAICNVLSLKNILSLSPDISEVSQEKLLSLVAERLIDSNSSIHDKDAGYVENQQQNIADAIDLLPRLATGIDVNIKFRRIDDFEFTRECTIFDLLDIPLYHGWIVDPQDRETANAIGSKSYNTVVEELVLLETQAADRENQNDPEDDVDFVAATTAALGVPSPCLSRGQSFDESPKKARKGDTEEEIELLRVMKLSEAEMSSSVPDSVLSANVNLVESPAVDKSELVCRSETVEKNDTDGTVKNGSISEGGNDLTTHNVPKTVEENNFIECTDKGSTESCKGAGDIKSDPQIENQNVQPVPVSLEFDSQPTFNAFQDKSRDVEHVNIEFTSTSDLEEPKNSSNDDCKARESCSLFAVAPGLDSSTDRAHEINKPDTFSSSIDGSEPIYEGEERIMESGCVSYENQEPVYEGEVVLAEQVGRGCVIDDEFKDRLSVKQGEVIRNFLKNSASQLTIYGLFCLQEKVKERELCVFFRNNHFNTMFKYEGELYILATDQGYLNQPDLVWEKLDEVNGDTLFMTGNFTEFKMDDQSNNSTWDEQNAISSTADYLNSMDGVPPSGSSFNSDLQLAIALQQQEFEQQQQQQKSQPNNSQQPSTSSASSLVTGPQVSQKNGKYTQQQPKSNKDKCIIM
ncbi:protein FAM63A [Striga asiatica]|uniref:Protein FAM63A n=1 Tax=Striga asiatica TaxID=4170 RepID=A0A5A7PDM7_STRAF|nr:protein FAM63A [Striga asiatica]